MPAQSHSPAHGARTCECGRPLDETATICRDCTADMKRILGNMADLVAELEVTFSRQRGTTYDGGGGSSSRDTPLPWDERAGTLLREARSTLAARVSQLAAEHLTIRAIPTGDIVGSARWLLWVSDAICHHEHGPSIVEELRDLEHQARRVIDNPVDRWPAGPCVALVQKTVTHPIFGPDHVTLAECGTDMTGRRGAREVKCPDCGAVYDAAQVREWLLDRARDQVVNATELGRILAWLGDTPVKPGTIRQWIFRGRLRERGRDRSTRPLYRVGDAEALMRDAEVEATVPA